MNFEDTVPIAIGGDPGIGDLGGGDGGGEPEIIPDAPEDGGEPAPEPDQPADGAEPTPESDPSKQAKPSADPVKDAINKLKATDPKGAEALRREHFQNTDYRKAFETPQAAREAKDLLESVGGADGLAAKEAELNDYAGVLTKLADGNPEVLDTVIADSKEGFTRLVPEANDRLKQVNPQAYMKERARLGSELLQEHNFPGAVKKLIAAIQRKDAMGWESALELSGQMDEWIAQVTAFGKREEQKPENDPERVKLNKEKQEFQAEKQKEYTSKIAKAAEDVTNPMMSKALAPYLKGKNLTFEQKGGIVREAWDDVIKSLTANKSFMSKRAGLLKKGVSTEEYGRFWASNVSTLVPNAIKAAWQRRVFAGAPARTNGTGTAAAASNGVEPYPPNDEDMDEQWKNRNYKRFMGNGQVGEYMTKSANGKPGVIRRFKWADRPQ
jgi:hypothetical protein